jgi:hypothetical protein
MAETDSLADREFVLCHRPLLMGGTWVASIHDNPFAP